jgi:hypothetical protein
MQHEIMNKDIFSEAQVAQQVWGGDKDLSTNLKRLAPPPVPEISTPSHVLKVETVDEEKEERFDEDDEEFGDFVSASVKPAPMPLSMPKPINTPIPTHPFKQPVYAVREDEEDDLLLPGSDDSNLDLDVLQFLQPEQAPRNVTTRPVQRHGKNAFIEDNGDGMNSDVLEFLRPWRQVALDEPALTEQNLAKLQAELRVQAARAASILQVPQQRWNVQQITSWNQEVSIVVEAKDKEKEIEDTKAGNQSENEWENATASTATLMNVVKTDSAKGLGLLLLSGEVEEEAIAQLQSWRDAAPRRESTNI